MQQPFAAAIAANRFGLGARPGELAAIGDNARDWLREQLLAPAPLLASAQLRPAAQILAEALELRREKQAARKAQPGAGGSAVAAAQNDVQQKLPQFLRPIYVSE